MISRYFTAHYKTVFSLKACAAFLSLARMESKEGHAQSEEAKKFYDGVRAGSVWEHPASAAEIYQEYRGK